jgi:hypothetical protein
MKIWPIKQYTDDETEEKLKTILKLDDWQSPTIHAIPMIKLIFQVIQNQGMVVLNTQTMH